VLWVAIGVFAGFAPTTLVDLAFLGTTAAALVLSCVGLAGAWRVFGAVGRRGAWIMLLSAIGIAVAFAIQPIAVAAAGNYGVPAEFRAGPSGFGPGGLFATYAPAAALLLGAMLAFVSTRPSARARTS